MPDGGTTTEITITCFDGFAARRKTERRVTLSQLQHEILTTTAPSKHELPWLKLARFGEDRTEKGSLRHDANVLVITGVEADYDKGEMAIQQAVDLLEHAGIKAMVYTSPSHTADGPRWRVLCPTSCDLPPRERRRLMDRLAKVFGGQFAGESWTLSQAYYYGAVAANPDHQVFLVDGIPIDLAGHLDSDGDAQPDSGTGRERREPGRAAFDEAALLNDILLGTTFHRPCVRLLGRWALDGVPFLVARQRLLDAFQNVPEAEREERWHSRYADIDRCLEDIYGKEADRKDADNTEAAAGSSTSAGRPTAIRYTPGQIRESVDLAEQALLGTDAGVYQRGTFLVRHGCVGIMVRDGQNVMANRIVEIGDYALVEILTCIANWEKFDGRSGKWTPTDAPMKVATTYQQRIGQWQVPVLSGVIDAPTLRPDGSILDQPGYDALTGLLLVKTATSYPDIPVAPGLLDALMALGRLEGLLQGFPFVDKASKSVALSCILSACIRRSLPTVPLHGFTAPAPGSGKSFLVDLVCLIASGREAAVMAQGRTNEELEKRLGALLLAGEPVIAIDNCDAPLGGDFLCAMITQQTTRVRILGRSEAPELPSNSLVTATGNNLQLEGDMARRAVLCQLDSREERPELRAFSFDPAADIKANRGQFVADALTVLRAYWHAGCPNRPTPLASFEAWSNWVRGALIWLGQDDPVETMEEVRELDPSRTKMVSIIEHWALVVGAADVSVARLIETACMAPVTRSQSSVGHDNEQYAHPEFREALLAVAGVQGAINSVRLGKWLAANKERLVAGHRIVRAGMSGGVLRWRLESGGRAP